MDTPQTPYPSQFSHLSHASESTHASLTDGTQSFQFPLRNRGVDASLVPPAIRDRLLESGRIYAIPSSQDSRTQECLFENSQRTVIGGEEEISLHGAQYDIEPSPPARPDRPEPQAPQAPPPPPVPPKPFRRERRATATPTKSVLSLAHKKKMERFQGWKMSYLTSKPCCICNEMKTSRDVVTVKCMEYMYQKRAKDKDGAPMFENVKVTHETLDRYWTRTAGVTQKRYTDFMDTNCKVTCEDCYGEIEAEDQSFRRNARKRHKGLEELREVDITPSPLSHNAAAIPNMGVQGSVLGHPYTTS